MEFPISISHVWSCSLGYGHRGNFSFTCVSLIFYAFGIVCGKLQQKHTKIYGSVSWWYLALLSSLYFRWVCVCALNLITLPVGWLALRNSERNLVQPKRPFPVTRSSKFPLQVEISGILLNRVHIWPLHICAHSHTHPHRRSGATTLSTKYGHMIGRWLLFADPFAC